MQATLLLLWGIGPYRQILPCQGESHLGIAASSGDVSTCDAASSGPASTLEGGWKEQLQARCV
eukprot:1084790-Amphidinium_carterae.1